MLYIHIYLCVLCNWHGLYLEFGNR